LLLHRGKDQATCRGEGTRRERKYRRQKNRPTGTIQIRPRIAAMRTRSPSTLKTGSGRRGTCREKTTLVEMDAQRLPALEALGPVKRTKSEVERPPEQQKGSVKGGDFGKVRIGVVRRTERNLGLWARRKEKEPLEESMATEPHRRKSRGLRSRKRGKKIRQNNGRKIGVGQDPGEF